ncbi:MAG: hypothetical protein RJB39_57 [Candidatus Parcubacteria bacterium]|jgi:hypothetical protein
MKYKRRIVTGAIALSLLVGGPTFAASGGQAAAHITRSAEHASRRDQFKNIKNKANHVVGAVTGINGTVITFVTQAGKNSLGAKTVSIDVQTNSHTTFEKNGLAATFKDIVVGQKIIVTGSIDATSQTITARKVKIATN